MMNHNVMVGRRSRCVEILPCYASKLFLILFIQFFLFLLFASASVMIQVEDLIAVIQSNKLQLEFLSEAFGPLR